MLPAASAGVRSQSTPSTRSWSTPSARPPATSAAGMRTAIPERSAVVEVDHPAGGVLQLDVVVHAGTVEVGGRADVQPVGDLRGPGPEDLGAVAAPDDEPPSWQRDRPRGHRPLGVLPWRGRELRRHHTVGLVEVERRQRLDDPHRPGRLDAAAQDRPGRRRASAGVGGGEPGAPVRLAGGPLVGRQLRLVAVQVDLVGEDPDPQLVVDEPRLEPDRQQRHRDVAGETGDAGLEARPGSGSRDHQLGNAAGVDGHPHRLLVGERGEVGGVVDEPHVVEVRPLERVAGDSQVRAGGGSGVLPGRLRPGVESRGRAGPVQLVEPEPRLGRLLLDDEEPAVAADAARPRRGRTPRR